MLLECPHFPRNLRVALGHPHRRDRRAGVGYGRQQLIRQKRQFVEGEQSAGRFQRAVSRFGNKRIFSVLALALHWRARVSRGERYR